jgi:hypothetical protein
MMSTGSTFAGIGDYFRTGAATSSDAELNPAPASAPRPAAPAAAHFIKIQSYLLHANLIILCL